MNPIVGDVIRGYWGGGNDGTKDMRVEIVAADYVVARCANGMPELLLSTDDDFWKYCVRNPDRVVQEWECD